jgi:hypothetical protein
MNVKRFHYYRANDGIFTGDSVSSSDPDFTPPSREGLRVYEGAADWTCERIDIRSGEKVAHIPPSPDSNHEWNVEQKRWVLTARARERATALQQLSELESKAHRAMRELALRPADETARTRIESIEKQMDALRLKLSDGVTVPP